jgi:hypothetical protein
MTVLKRIPVMPISRMRGIVRMVAALNPGFRAPGRAARRENERDVELIELPAEGVRSGERSPPW